MNAAPTATVSAGPILDISELSVALPSWADRPQAVKQVSLQIGAGETLCVVGESGSGKSVMARAILRLLPEPQVRIVDGRVLLEGEDLAHADDKRMRAVRGGKIAMIFQEPMVALNPLMTIGRQIDEILEAHTDWGKAERRRRVVATFEDVRLPDPARIFGAYPHELSGGQRQRVMIAMSLVLEPRLIIADEPTTALDVTTEAQILSLLKELQQRHGTALLFITHNFGVVAEIADRVAVMRRGEVVEHGDAEEVLTRPRHPYTRALIEAVPSLVPRKGIAGTDKSAAEPILEIRRLDKIYGRRAQGASWLTRWMPGLGRGRRQAVHAVNQIDLDVKRGSAVAVVGESGSGKSTLARCLIGLEQADAGSVKIAGNEIVGLSRSAWRPLRSRVQMVFQDPFASLNPRTSVGDIIARGAILQGEAPDAAMSQARELLTLVGLEPKAAERYPHEFSGGQRQRIGIARALAVKPDILIADEPVSALDVSVQKQVLDLLDSLRRRFGLTMLFITHDLRVAAHVCEEIVVLKSGRIVEHGKTAEIFADPRHEYTRALLSSVPGRDWQLRLVGSSAGPGTD
ncbi:ABC transporter ATP-binding protein [Neoroseomonas oryzicola]|uniref:ABC transporter ATP-binding protein n=1 Tax=Neoroseomonas oryzicola TaxID=535904 RepID=A0A9X9WQ90_9PROT|nr:ABC transporter ATP-binding protein [Neoroseomonas oryzicola]MBR0662500.1 ABC transporter ATP-binding protein [Neoroseomonas oryzicola]NKE20317.1 ABC transporter ATP-binding protein [Neoroseomonas oryzicola]